MTRTTSFILGFAAFCLTASLAQAHISTAAPEDGSTYSHKFTDDGAVNGSHRFTDDGAVNGSHRFTDDGAVNGSHKCTG
jgi:hypothetical protein